MAGTYILLLFMFAYLCGSIPFGKIIARHYGIDIQKRGSGNIGFANVRRILGWRAGIFTLIGDVTKGIIPTALALIYIGQPIAFFVGLAAIAGHLHPIWLRFRGGKGIATGLGVVIVLQPIAAAVGALTYIIGCIIIKKSSYSSLIGLAITTIVGIYLSPDSWWQYCILTAIACWTLRKNLLRTMKYSYDT